MGRTAGTVTDLGELRKRFEQPDSLRELPRYTVADAARYLRVPYSTLRYWVEGSGRRASYSEPLIRVPDKEDGRLSFSNLVEAHVLRALRWKHNVYMSAIRKALQYTRDNYEIDRLLLSRALLAAPGSMFLEVFENSLDDLGAPGQMAIRENFRNHLDRVVRDAQGEAKKLFPVTRENAATSPRLIAIDPEVSFGRPIVDRLGIKTSAIVRRFRAGESVRTICNDYRLKASEVEEALRYEGSAA